MTTNMETIELHLHDVADNHSRLIADGNGDFVAEVYLPDDGNEMSRDILAAMFVSALETKRQRDMLLATCKYALRTINDVQWTTLADAIISAEGAK